MIVDEGDCIVCGWPVDVHQYWEEDGDGYDNDGNYIHGDCRKEEE